VAFATLEDKGRGAKDLNNRGRDSAGVVRTFADNRDGLTVEVIAAGVRTGPNDNSIPMRGSGFDGL
jgi:hypothetical protein